MTLEATSNNTTTDGSQYIGIDLSGSTLHLVRVNGDGTLGERREAAIEHAQLFAQLVQIIGEMRSAVGAEIGGVGVGVPGLVDPTTNRVVMSSDLPSLTEGDFSRELASQLNVANVMVENDANAAAYGEFVAGAGRGSRHMFYALLGAGVGGAIILGGRLWHGASGFAGEFGHITISPEGVECVCGNTGCLETVASAPNIVRRTHERLFRDSTSSLSKLALNRDFTAADIAREARNGDDFALLMIERTGRYIGTGVATVINLLNIERIVIGGGVMEAGDLILDPIIREAKRRSFQPCFDATEIVSAQLAGDAVAIGAAMLARDTARKQSL